MKGLRELTAEYVEVRQERLALEAKARELAQGREADLQAAILALMAAEGVSSVRFPGLGRIVRRSKGHYEIRDIEKLSFAMFRGMVAAYHEARPLSDALLLQRRISKENLESIFDGEENAPDLGVAYVEKDELSVTKN